jgi:predicted dehydrogenase
MSETTKPCPVGIIGTGNISTIYLKNAAWLTPIDVVAVADVRREAAAAQAAAHNIARVLTVEEPSGRPDDRDRAQLDHPRRARRGRVGGVAAGKSVYNEKPLALTHGEAQAMLRQRV